MRSVIKAPEGHDASYFHELLGLDSFVYSVWLIGPTDGWPNAIFYKEEDAQKYASENDNREGVIIMKHNFFDLIESVYNSIKGL